MAVESEDVLKMVSGDEQPIDLSKTARKPPRNMPPLIPISILRAGYYDHHLFCKRNGIITLTSNPSLPQGTEIFTIKTNKNCTVNQKKTNARTAVPLKTKSARNCDFEFSKTECAPHSEHELQCEKVRQKRHIEDEQTDDDWVAKRLDRAHSVPHLTPFPFPLQRQKSLSESRIPVVTASSSNSHKNLFYSHDGEASQSLCNSFDQPQLSNLCHRLFHEHLLQHENWSYKHGIRVVNPPLDCAEYKPQLMHEYHAQELLQQCYLQNQNNNAMDHGSENISSIAVQVELPSEGCNDSKRRSSRPLTGKHVRPGTGASPATLLSLRRKIQARQQQQE